MKVKVLGIQQVDYVSKKTGNPVSGVTLHVSYNDAGVKGMATEKVFLSDNLELACMKDLAVGQIVDVEHNMRGYVCGCEIVNK